MSDKPKSWPLPELDAFFQVPKYTALPPDPAPEPTEEEARMKNMSPYGKLEWLEKQLSKFIDDRYSGVDLGDMLQVVQEIRQEIRQKMYEDDKDYKWSKKRTVHKTLTFDDYKGD